jgi:SAM-dependent methyltransferase
VNPYRHRVWDLFQPLLAEVGPVGRALDFGSGDGWFANQFRTSGRVKDLVPVDVLRRENVLVEPVLYDGVTLPFPDRSFDLTYAVDVLHHCPDPAVSLRDLLRVTGKWFLLKDHTWRTKLGKYLLAGLDEIGNRKFGVPCLYKHQRGWEWDAALAAAGFERVRLVHPARCHWGLMRWVNRFEFVALWRRAGAG